MNVKQKEEQQEKPIIRCAIYTRKSISDGLERDFTTLDAQRESCESYIASQKNSGWICLPEKYDDGGFTGANTDRPALQKLMADIKAGTVNCVVVYKVDRLSRSLLDFAELLSIFEENNITFVSVTQHFNTQNSMGRLTLNILLSFAQFEREIISERTRDKMCAAKRKGKWLGGHPPLGYDVDKKERKLIINPKEAEIVREIFDLYLEKCSIMAVTKILNEKGYLTKLHESKKGKSFGGITFKISSVQRLLRNVLYMGKVQHLDILYPGEQEAIVSEEIFQKAQEMLAKNKPEWSMAKTNKHVGLLSGILRCKSCNCAMYFTYQVKEDKYKYHYYLCINAIKRGYQSCPVRLVNARKIEEKIVELLRATASFPKLDAKTWELLTLKEKIPILKSIIKEASYDWKKQILEIALREGIRKYEFPVDIKDLKNQPSFLNQEKINKEPKLKQNLILAHQIQKVISEGRVKDLKQMANCLNMSNIKVYVVMNLLLLAPDIQEEILLDENESLFSVPEYKINEISRQMSWAKQKEMWQVLFKNPAEK
ncbi:MAG: recombinase family protein [Candidatus Omnitrophota bacterium]